MTAQPIIPLSEAKQPLFLGCDVGGTNIKIGLVDDLGRTLGFEEIATEEPRGAQAAVERMAAAGRRIATKAGTDLASVARVGLGTPGSMDIARGLMLQPPNHPHWWNFPIRDALAKATGLPVTFVNDANAAAWGEFWLGPGEKHSSMILLTLGTGVGGGIITDNHLINGVNSFGSECGHVIVDSSPTARYCVWGGGQGHLEAYASASAVVARATEMLKGGAKSSLQKLLAEGMHVTAKQIFLAAEAGDAFSLQIIDDTAFYLSIGLVSMAHMVDPGLIVLGGAMNFGGHRSPVGRGFLEKVRSRFRDLAYPNVAAGTIIDFATLGADAGYLGAAGVARDDHRKQS